MDYLLLEEKIKNIKVDINDGASDIILYIYKNKEEGAKYLNLSTNICSSKLNNVTRVGQRYILWNSFYYKHRDFDMKMLDGWNMCGMRIYHNKELDVLLVIFAHLEHKNSLWLWEENDRYAFFTKEDNRIGFIGDNISNIKMMSYRLDICGQTIVPVNNIVDFDLGLRSPLSSGSKEAIMSFLGGYYVEEKEGENIYRCRFSFRPLINTEDALEHLLYISNNDAKRKVLRNGSMYKDKFIKHKDDPLPPLPAEAFKLMDKITRGCIYKFMPDTSRVEKNSCFTCLQRVGNDVWHREYCAVVIWGSPITNSKIEFVEKKRVKIGENYEDYAMRPNLDFLVYMDGSFKGTIFEYVSKPIEEWLRYVKNADNKIWGFVGLFDEIDNMENIFFKKYKCFPCRAIRVMDLQAQYPILEKLLLFAKERNIKNMYDYIIEMASDEDFGDFFVEYILGGLEKPNGAPHEMIGIPKAMLEAVIKENNFNKIKKIKDLFSSYEAKNYLKRLNEKDCCEMVSALRTDYIIRVLKLLFMHNGHKSWKAYINYINELTIVQREKYEKYLMLVLGIGKSAEEAEWNINPDYIERTYNSLREVSKITSDDETLCFIDYMFKKRKDEWEKYCYEGKNYIISYPKDSQDVIREGIKLRHCAKNFLEQIAYGQTTLLFIRRKWQENKPFYTMEIRDKKIRQCHGFGNCNIDKEAGLDTFLKTFCEEKNIVFSEGARLLGA